MRGNVRFAAFGVGLLLTMGACGGSGDAATPTAASDENAEPTRLEIESFDFGYEISPDPVPAGEVETVLTNIGKQPHQVLLYRLNDGVDFDDFKEQVMEDDSALPQLAEGGTDGMRKALGTGDTESSRGDHLVPGTYAAICWVRDQSGATSKNHAELGMITRFEVE